MPSPHHHRRLRNQSYLHPWQQARHRSPSRLDIAGKRRLQLMNSKNTSNSLPKISTRVIRFTGGSADALNSQTSFAWLVISCVSPVSCQPYSICTFLIISPGSAVAVERIFSGGRDTISLRRASLHADTIRVLMLVKKRLHLARAQANIALRR